MILREADAVDTRRRQRVVDLAREELGPDLRGKRITVWGAAFKPETDDIRDSPALAVAQALHDLGVTVTDPKALDNARKLHPELDYTEDPIAAVQDADLLCPPSMSLRRRSGQEAGTPSISAGEEVIRMPLPDWRTSRCCIPSVEWNAVPNHSVVGWPLSPRGWRGLCCL
ncbi:UDP binding domain-containing protein [Streptomyces sp. NPDC101234]|uniref:UDP binding domain-containing protein n=1 Tax=Streptomyces sp. NPDC101234 TaxID=3366138 RepID=UPI00381B772B